MSMQSTNNRLFPPRKVFDYFHSLFNFNLNNDTNPAIVEGNSIIKEQVRTEPLHGEENVVIKNISLEFPDIFYVKGDNLTYTNKIKHSIDPGNSRPTFTKSYPYLQLHKESVKPK